MKYIQPTWPAPAHIKAYTTLRQGWGDPSSAAKSPASTASLTSLLHLPTDPYWLTQTHSTLVVEATPTADAPEADASYTSQPQRVCTVLTADCMPILICHQQGSHVAAIHAGWRGLAGGIIENTLNKLRLPPEELLVWLGPAIGPQKFEVGNDVFQAFTTTQPETHVGFTPHGPDKWLANLYELARIKLKKQGITQIYGGEYCTHTQADLFYSYRRDQGKTGRMASVIWIESTPT